MTRKLTIRTLATLAGLFGSAALADPPPADAGLAGAVALSASINLTVYALPSGCAQVLLYDLTYFKCAGVWYLPQYSPAGVSYLRVPPQSWSVANASGGG